MSKSSQQKPENRGNVDTLNQFLRSMSPEEVASFIAAVMRAPDKASA